MDAREMQDIVDEEGDLSMVKPAGLPDKLAKSQSSLTDPASTVNEGAHQARPAGKSLLESATVEEGKGTARTHGPSGQSKADEIIDAYP